MSDLRTRIAAVLLAHGDESDFGPDCTCGWEWHGYGLWKDEYAGHLADAVIEALNLRTDQVGTLTRYVTEWIDNG